MSELPDIPPVTPYPKVSGAGGRIHLTLRLPWQRDRVTLRGEWSAGHDSSC